MRAYRESDYSNYSNAIQAITLGAPASLTTETISASQIILTWQDNSDREDGFEIYRGTDADYKKIGEKVDGNLVYEDGNLAAETEYHYQVRAYVGTVEGRTHYSAFSNMAIAKTVGELKFGQVTITSNPEGRTIIVDDTSRAVPYVFSWAVGSEHTIGADSLQSKDGDIGIRYRFDRWDSGYAREHVLTVSADSTVETALFIRQYFLAVVSERGNPKGMGWYDEGVTATWSVDSPTPDVNGVRYVADPSSGSVRMAQPDTVNVSWNTQYRLAVSASPEAGGTVNRNLTDDWLAEDAEVELTAFASDGYIFSEWQGVAPSSTTNPLTVTMDASRTITAVFTASTPVIPPVLPPAGGGTPSISVSSVFDFGDTTLGTPIVRELSIKNTGTGLLRISNIVSDDDAVTPHPTTLEIQPDSTRIVTLTFIPRQAAHAGTLIIESNDPQKSGVSVALSGLGIENIPPSILDTSPVDGAQDIAPKQLQATGVRFRFSEPIDTMKAQISVMKNGALVEWLPPVWSDNNSVLTLHPKPENGIGFGVEYEITLSHVADTAGNEAEKVIRVSFVTETKKPVLVILLAPEALDYGDVEINTVRDMNILLKNAGNDTLVVRELAVPNGYTLSVSERIIQPDSTDTLIVHFAPTEVKRFTGDLTFTSNDSERPGVRIPLSGNGVQTEQAPPVAEDAIVSLRVEPDTLTAGDTVRVSVVISTSSGVAAGDFVVVFPDSVLDVVSVDTTNLSAISRDSLVFAFDYGPTSGRVKVAFASMAPFFNGTLFSVVCKVKASVEDTTVAVIFDQVSAWDELAREMHFDPHDGEMVVRGKDEEEAVLTGLQVTLDLDPKDRDQGVQNKRYVAVGDTITLQLFAKDLPEVIGFGGKIQFDAEVLVYVESSFTAGELFPGAQVLAFDNGGVIEAGVVLLGSTTRGSGLLAQIKFIVARYISDSTELKLIDMAITLAGGNLRDVDIRLTVRLEGGLAGDFDGDGVVGFRDFLLFAGAFGGNDTRYDLDGDGIVGFRDFLLFAGLFGKQVG